MTAVLLSFPTLINIDNLVKSKFKALRWLWKKLITQVTENFNHANLHITSYRLKFCSSEAD